MNDAPPARTPAGKTRAPSRVSAVAKRTRRGPGSYDRALSPEERRDAQRRAIVEAAAHVFARDGFAGASVASILEVSGLSRGTFYRHFRDLPEAFVAVQQNGAEALFERIDAACREAPSPPERLRAAIASYLELCREHSDLFRVLHREARISGTGYEELRRRSLDRLRGVFREGLAEAVSQGIAPRVPDDVTISAVVAAIEGVALMHLEEHRERDLPAAVEPLFRLALRAFS